MKEYIKGIRAAANMSQEQFAKAIGTTAVSINRWENGKAKPNKLAQKQLYEFCQEYNIDLVDMILKNKQVPSSECRTQEGWNIHNRYLHYL